MIERFNADTKNRRVIGIFSYLDDLLKGIKTLREADLSIESVFSPAPRREIEEALRPGPSPVRYFTFFGGLLGVLFGLGLAIYAHLQWKLITGGKPVIAWIPFVVIAFECCILIGVISTILGMSIKNRMPRFRLPEDYDSRFTDDRFAISVSCPEDKYEEVSRILREAGAEEIK